MSSTSMIRNGWNFGLRRTKSAVPGFGISLSLTMAYLSLVVLIPLSAVVLSGAGMGWARFFEVVTGPRVLASYRLTIGAAAAAALFNAVCGLLVAWVLVRYEFPGKHFIDALVDLPFALPTAVAGIALSSLYAENGWIGRLLAPYGVRVAFTPAGVALALAFVGFPFVVRNVQPVIRDLDSTLEEAASSLGASSWQRFRRVIFPTIFPALMSGTVLAFARGLGEYGSVIFIAGNMPMRTEITSLLIVTKLEQFDYQGATAIALAMLILSFTLLLAMNLLQWRSQRWEGER